MLIFDQPKIANMYELIKYSGMPKFKGVWISDRGLLFGSNDAARTSEIIRKPNTFFASIGRFIYSECPKSGRPDFAVFETCPVPKS